MTASQHNNKPAPAATKPAPKTYGKIILTLQNCLLPDEAFIQTPSQADGLDIETETDLRILGCELIQTAGILLKMPQVAMATGQVYVQRFYYSKSFVRYPMEIMAMGSIYLASKIEEKPCRIRDVINVFHHIKQVRAQKPISPLLLDNNYIELKNQVIKAERRILKELGFCVHVKHPHKLIVVYLQLLSYEKNKQLMQLSWNYMNDALRTDVFVRFQPETIACACIYLTARKIGLPLPNNPHWFSLFSVKEEDIQDVCMRILRLYNRSKVNSDEVERKVEIQKRIYQANKMISLGVLGPTAATYAKNTESRDKSGQSSPTGSAVTSNRDDKRDRKETLKSTTPPLKHHSRKYKHDRGGGRSRSRSHDRKERPHKKPRTPPALSPPRRHRSKHHHSDRSRSRDSRDDKRKY